MKKSSIYVVDDTADNAKPSTLNAMINKRKTPEKSSEVGTNDEAPTKQPHTTAPASVAVLVDASSLPTSLHLATPTPITITSPSKTNTPTNAILPEEINFSPLQSCASVSPHLATEDAKGDDTYSEDCNVTKEQFFKYRCGVAGTKATAKEPPEEPGRVDNSRPFLRAVDPAAWQEPPWCWEFDHVHHEHTFFSPDEL
eukprot:9853496-Ditylum_brightwellii.AAC.1